MGRSENLHLAINAVHKFKTAEGRYPADNADDLNKVVQIAKGVNEENKAANGCSVDEVDEAIVRKTAAYCQSSLTSMSAFLGGFIAQEIVKYTGKYMPLR